MEPHKLTKLRQAFNNSLNQTTGSENKIIVDENDLHWGVEWKSEIEQLIQSSRAIIAIVTP
jgi:hypothetical protein